MHTHAVEVIRDSSRAALAPRNSGSNKVGSTAKAPAFLRDNWVVTCVDLEEPYANVQVHGIIFTFEDPNAMYFRNWSSAA